MYKMLRKKLEEQLKLLKNSAELFDKGKNEEALNIAIRLRVLFYRDEALLEQLGQKKTIRILSTLEDYSKDPLLKNIKIQSSVHFLTSNGQRAFLNKTGRSEFIPLEKWLTETIITLENKPYSRIDIIKITAHKDGAAHIEIDHESLKPFITPFGKFTINENNKPVTKEISSHHYILLRQIAYEVLHSEELFTLNGLDFKPMEEIKSYNEYLIEADKFNEDKKYYKAIKLYEKAIDVNPSNATFAYNNMGNCLSKIGEKEEAINSYKKSTEQDTENIDPLWNLSLIYNQVKRYDLTIELYQKILKIDKQHQGANHNLRTTLNILIDFEDQILEQYNNYRENKPINLTYIDYLGTSLLRFGYIQEAEDFYKYSLKVSPNNINYMNNLAYTYYKQEKYSDVNKILNDIIDIGTDRIEIILNILEFKLVKDFEKHDKLLEFFNKENMIYYKIFSFLYQLSNNEKCNETFDKLLNNVVYEKINYDYTEIKKWSIEKNIDQMVIPLIEKYFILTTP